MDMSKKSAIFACLMQGLALAGCVTTQLTADGQNIRITDNPNVVADCEYIGDVQGSDNFNGGLAGQGAAEENASRRLRNSAAEMGADTVDISTKTTGFSGSAIRGEAYRCQSQ